MARLWVVRGGREGKFEQTAVEKNKMGLGWNMLGDLRSLKDKAAVVKRLRKAYPNPSDGTLRNWASQLYRFAEEIREGDIVVMPCKGKDHVFIGSVDGEYDFDPDAEFAHLRPVKWKKEPVPRDVFRQDLRKAFNTPRTVCEASKNDAVNRVRLVLENGFDPGIQNSHFDWIPFYEAAADALRDFKNERNKLLDGILAMESRMDKDEVPFTNLEDTYPDKSKRTLEDICPFTAMGTFNRTIRDDHRETIAGAFREFLKVKEPAPRHWQGTPVLHAMNSWFFASKEKRGENDIDKLWEIFERAISLAESDDQANRAAFIRAYDDAVQAKNVSWNLTMGLFWIRPWSFPTLDEKSRKYIDDKEFGISVPQEVPDGARYLEITDELKTRFKETDCPVNSFPELSLAADKTSPPPLPSYSVNDIMEEGCFLEPSGLEEILERLESKKNIVLQGPPGTGKTWLAKKLAFALVGSRSENHVLAVQFHPSLSYEDFVRGWRPSGDGKLSLVDGPFLEMAETARQSPRENHVIVIEEINRGNPAQIFGELLTLLEADKRNKDSGLALSYPREGERVFIPENLYAIGTMNIADRSLALVDFALRRRFAFIDLEPLLNDRWSEWCNKKCGISYAVLEKIRKRVSSLNQQISDDPGLGPQFKVGHSYVTPNSEVKDPEEWFRRVVNTEIAPLLREYWFDNPENAEKAVKDLLEGD